VLDDYKSCHHKNNGDDKAENMTGLPVKRNHKASYNVPFFLVRSSVHDMISPRLVVQFRRNTNNIRYAPDEIVWFSYAQAVLFRFKVDNSKTKLLNFNSKMLQNYHTNIQIQKRS
jgi:hypothetical protein